MEIKISRIPENEPEHLYIMCHEVTSEVREIIHFVKSLQGTITGDMEDKQYEIQVPDILYVETVDNRTYIYTSKHVYSSRLKLYELESLLQDRSFSRISKSLIVNLLKIRSMKPALNGRFCATLMNGEDVIISRKYVQEFKEKIQGGGKR